MKYFALALLCSFLTDAAMGAQHPVPVANKMVTGSPWGFVGQLTFFSGKDEYVGTGVVVSPKSVLTAGHNVYDPDTGWSTRLLYRRDNFGTEALTNEYASHLYLLGGYQSAVGQFGPDDVRSFAFDTAGLVYPKALTKGGRVMVSANPLLLKGYYYHVAFGYGAEGAHDGDHMLKVKPVGNFTRTYGSFYENLSIYIEGGMSGGPMFSLFAGKFYLSGVVVSGSENPESGGIRIVDNTTLSFIVRYLP
jgi:V8-like Glu-specific endopeptidase